jgi:putative transposase
VKNRFIAILKESGAGVEKGELCRRHGLRGASFYRWKSKGGRVEVSKAKQLNQLEEEPRQLKHIVAGRAVGVEGGVGEEVVRPQIRREVLMMQGGWSKPATRLRADGNRSLGTCRYRGICQESCV